MAVLWFAPMAAADPIRMRGPHGQTIDVSAEREGYYRTEGFRRLSSAEEFREIADESARHVAERERAEHWQTVSIIVLGVALGWAMLYLVRRHTSREG